MGITKTHNKCPECGGRLNLIVNMIEPAKYQCANCGKSFTTEEILSDKPRKQLKGEVKDMSSKKGKCEGCGKIRTLLAHNKCYSCNGYGKGKNGEKTETKKTTVGKIVSLPDTNRKIKIEFDIDIRISNIRVTQ